MSESGGSFNTVIKEMNSILDNKIYLKFEV